MPKIIKAKILPGRCTQEVHVQCEEDEEFQKLFDYYVDELTFAPEEFVGLTIEEGHALFTKKDVAYLQSP